MESLADTEKKILEIREKFSNGLYVFVGLVKNKRDIFGKLKESYSDELRMRLDNIIHNQLVLIDYFDNKAIPFLIFDIKKLLHNFGLKNDPKTKAFLDPMLKSLFYAETNWADYKKLILKQQEILQKNPDKLRIDTKILVGAWIKYEESQVQKFFEKFDKIEIEEFNKYIKTIGFEIEHALKVGTLAPGMGVGGILTGTVFMKVIQMGFVSSGIGLENFPTNATSLVEILFAIAGIAGALYMAKSQLKEKLATV